MGTEHDNEYAMYLDCGEAGYRPLYNLELEEIDLVAEGLQDGLQNDSLVYYPPLAVTVRLGRTSRKRFIKMLMSYGRQRDGAVALAAFYHKMGISYAMALMYSTFTLNNKANADF
ncbi:MAG: hypothetical protein LUC89_05775 [Oscillospiraceae bacterium]|nr:hypothetical protein [Oscillospiraceae bacterium]